MWRLPICCFREGAWQMDTVVVEVDGEFAARQPARPFVKWAGGKGRAAELLKNLLPRGIRRYYEPMVGGGALFFALENEAFSRFRGAVLGDTNAELMAAYGVITSRVDELVQALRMWTYDKATFLRVRAKDPDRLDPVVRAARMIYLNKTCFNGLYRVNQKGQFNVPFGRYTNPTICDEPNLRAVNEVLRRRGVRLMTGDYVSVVAEAARGDACYFDPPYLPVSKTANFTQYGAGGFALKDHERLAAEFTRLAQADVAVVLSNSDTETTRALYRDFEIRTVLSQRNINRDATKRRPVREIVVLANCP
jgi:DNA adenine methylase